MKREIRRLACEVVHFYALYQTDEEWKDRTTILDIMNFICKARQKYTPQEYQEFENKLYAIHKEARHLKARALEQSIK